EDPSNQDKLMKLAREGKPPPGLAKENGEKIVFDLGDRGKVSYSWVELGRQERRSLDLDNAAANDEKVPPKRDRPRNSYWKIVAQARDSTKDAMLQFANGQYVSPDELKPVLKAAFTKPLDPESITLTGDEKSAKEGNRFQVLRLTF